MLESERQRQPEPALALDVAFVPAFVQADEAARHSTVYIVVDVVRATTTLSVLFDRGCARAWVAPGIATARAEAERAPDNYLLGGEAGGLAPAGFDLGNSPREYATAEVANREVLFVTTNGTRALRACAGGVAIFAGAFRNAGAVTQAALSAAVRVSRQADTPLAAHAGAAPSAEESEAVLAPPSHASAIVIVCAGRMGRPAYDDTLCAGYLAERVTEAARARGWAIHPGEGARIALEVARGMPRQPERLRAALAASDAGHAVTAVGLADDLAWCAAIDATQVVPQVASYDAARDLLELRPAGAVDQPSRQATERQPPP